MNRLVAAALLLAACKGGDQKPIDAAVVVTKPRPDATPAGFDCTAVGARMAGVFTEHGGALKPRDVEQLFTRACIDDGWSEAASKCAIAIPQGQGADACLQLLEPYPMVALAARLRRIGALPFQDVATVDAVDCEAATTQLGLTIALRSAKTAAPGASARTYTQLFQGLANELGEMCTDQAWPDSARTCLARTRLPDELDQIDACLGALPADTVTVIANLAKEAERVVLDLPSVATGGDDCAAVGDAMVKIWTLKAERSMAKHPDEAKWDLAHLDDLRALVVAACTEDAWPGAVRTCVTGLKLPAEAPQFQDCIGALPPPALESLGKRTEALEAARDHATGAAP